MFSFPEEYAVENRSDSLSEGFHDSPGQGKTLWNGVQRYLRAGQYDQLVHTLQEVQGLLEQSGATDQAHILAAAREVCIACGQSTKDAEALRQAYQATVERERQLQQQLQVLLHLAFAVDPQHFTAANTQPPPEEEESNAAGSLWQRLHRFLGGAPEQSNNHIAPPPPLPAAGPEPGSAEPPPPPNRPAEPEPKAEDAQPEEERPSLTVYALGTFRVYASDRLVEGWSGNKSKSIFKYMLFHRGPVHREVLMDAFWPEEDPEVARRNLYQTIYLLRQAFADDVSYILCENSAYLLNPELTIWVDSDVFRNHYRRGKRFAAAGQVAEAMREFEAADNLYGGDFLGEDRYEDWPVEMREDLRHVHLEMLDWLSQQYFMQQQYAVAITYARKILKEDRCREDVHRRLMQAYYQLGQRNLALRQYQQCVKQLKAELNVEPMPATVELFEQVQRNGL